MGGLIEQVNWPEVLIGLLIPLVPVLVVNAVRVVRLRRTPQWAKFKGEFFLYHWSGTKSETRVKKVYFSTTFSGRIRAEMPTDQVTNLAYSGELRRGSGEVSYATLHGLGHEENIFLILYSPINPGFKVTRGIMSSVTLDGHPCAWPMILSRSQLAKADIERLLDKRRLLKAKKVSFGEF